MITEQYPMTIAGDPVATEDHLLTRVETGITMPAASVRYLIIHCSATRCDRDYPVSQLRRDHLARGFLDIGYHLYIRKDGTVTQHRRYNEVGAHCRPFNRCSIGICYEGGLDESGRPKDTRTLAQRSALVRLLKALKQQFPQALIRGHNEMPGATTKACPCFKPSKDLSFLDTPPFFQSPCPLPRQ